MPEARNLPKKSPESSLGFAYRLGIEFISGILVGLFFGYTIDSYLGTQPWGLVIMVLLGAGAGLLTIFRLLGLGRKSPSPLDKDKDG